MSGLLALFAVGAISYGYRSVFVLLAGCKPFPARVEQGLRYASPAMIAGLIGSILSPAHGGGGVLTVALVAAMAVGALIAYRVRSIGWTMVSGLAVYWPLVGAGLG